MTTILVFVYKVNAKKALCQHKAKIHYHSADCDPCTPIIQQQQLQAGVWREWQDERLPAAYSKYPIIETTLWQQRACICVYVSADLQYVCILYICGVSKAIGLTPIKDVSGAQQQFELMVHEAIYTVHVLW